VAHIACIRCKREAGLFVKHAREENWRKRKWWHYYACEAEAVRRVKTYMAAARRVMKYCNAAH
jgi:hypothetical protein